MESLPRPLDESPVRPARISGFAVYHATVPHLLDQARVDLPRSEFGDVASIVRVKLDRLDSRMSAA